MFKYKILVPFLMLISLLLSFNGCSGGGSSNDTITLNGYIFEDNGTGFIWQDSIDNEKKEMSWKDAKDYCENLNYNGYLDWRMPLPYELETLVDNDNDMNIIDGFHYMSHDNYSMYWSDELTEDGTKAYGVDFTRDVVHYAWYKDENHYIRCIRDTKNNSFDRVVEYNGTKLIWQDSLINITTKLNWQEAKEYCENLDYAGRNDWRLPTLMELATIVDTSKKPAIKDEFRFLADIDDWPAYWSSQVYKDNFNNLTWNDYVSLPLDSNLPHDIHFASKEKKLNGFLVTPGRTLIRVEFNSYNDDNYLTVPLVKDDIYDLVISTSDIDSEDVYMVTSGRDLDSSDMVGFNDVTKNEPDNNISSATKIPLMGGKMVSYLHKNDIDFYQLVDIPMVESISTPIYIDSNISVVFNTEIDTTTLTTQNIKLTDSFNNNIYITLSLNDKNLTISPEYNLTAGQYKVFFSSNIKSETGYNIDEKYLDINVEDYP